MFKENTIYCGDNEKVMKTFPDKSVDLIYLDPPFFTQRNYEIIWNDGSEIRAFNDRWKGGKKGIYNYIEWMRPKIEQMYRLLKDTGSIYLHCDWHASHNLKILCDEIFGYENFRNEIIWHYISAPECKYGFGKKHDTILFYSKTKNIVFNKDIVRVPHNKNTKSIREYKHNGKIYICNTNPKGKACDDVWDMPIISATSKERLGYPTQKPEKLLERIILASSNEGDIMLDSFCGCGTSLAVAYKLGRRFIGIDISPTACKLVAKRMRKIGKNISENDIIGLPHTIEELKNISPYDFQNWVCQKLNARVLPNKSGDMGIDGWTMGIIPIQVKQSYRVGRNVVDNFETAIRRKNKKEGIIIAFSFVSGAYAEVSRVKNEEELDIALITTEELVNNSDKIKKYLWI